VYPIKLNRDKGFLYHGFILLNTYLHYTL